MSYAWRPIAGVLLHAETSNGLAYKVPRVQDSYVNIQLLVADGRNIAILIGHEPMNVAAGSFLTCGLSS